MHDRQPIRELLGLLQVVGGEQHSGAALQQVTDQLPRPLPALRIQARRGLVQEQHLGVAENGDGHIESAAFPAGEPLDADSGPMEQPDQVQDLVDRPRPAQCSGPHPHRLGDREVSGKSALLQHDPDPRANRAAGPEGAMAEDPDGARRRGREPLDDLEGGGLPRPVCSPQRVQLASADRETHSPNGLKSASATPRKPSAQVAHLGDSVVVHTLVIHTFSIGPGTPIRRCTPHGLR